MTAPNTGLVGRTVMAKLKRGDVTAEEACEVVGCHPAGEFGYWKILVATHEGTLIPLGASDVRLVATPDGEGPYR